MSLYRRVVLLVGYLILLTIIVATVVHRFGYLRGVVLLVGFAFLHEYSSEHPVFPRRKENRWL